MLQKQSIRFEYQIYFYWVARKHWNGLLASRMSMVLMYYGSCTIIVPEPKDNDHDVIVRNVTHPRKSELLLPTKI